MVGGAIVIKIIKSVSEDGKHYCTHNCFKKMFREGNPPFNEDLDEYDEVLTYLDLKWSIAEEINSREVLGIKTMVEEPF